MFSGYWTFPRFSQSEVCKTGNSVELSLIKQILKLKTFSDNSFQVGNFLSIAPALWNVTVQLVSCLQVLYGISTFSVVLQILKYEYTYIDYATRTLAWRFFYIVNNSWSTLYISFLFLLGNTVFYPTSHRTGLGSSPHRNATTAGRAHHSNPARGSGHRPSLVMHRRLFTTNDR